MTEPGDKKDNTVFKPTAFLRLQRAWFSLDPFITGIFRCLPKLLNAIAFRSLARVFGVHSVAVDGDRGTIFGSPLDLGVFGEYLRTRTYAPKLVNFILGFFRERGQGTFIDVGANIGLVTVPMARAGMTCIAFEPDPDNFRFLERNIRESGAAERVTAHNVALFDRATELRFERSGWNFGDHRVRNPAGSGSGIVGEQHRSVIAVVAKRLDDLVSPAALKKPVVIKMDTEGSEVNIFRGGRAAISAADLVIFEFSPYVIRRLGEDENELIRFAEEHFRTGFVLHHDNEHRDIVFQDIRDVVRRLRAFSKSVTGIDHVDVFLAK